ncbi:hypothetical protein PCASD_21885 [Puccinia coronata f. sp. avenae]|uniref:Uncharacterized protein n=1 Tax=Puccinia coronata f. sp. avenae TaxID=200324 RepID=A0A2N5SHT4_9BASI|nr:hypothetical protein PCASD_21885 [Puccinia coronata f. sp. avenae]
MPDPVLERRVLEAGAIIPDAVTLRVSLVSLPLLTARVPVIHAPMERGFCYLRFQPDWEWSLKSALVVLKHQHQMPKGVIRPIEEIVWKEVLARLEHDANIRTLESQVSGTRSTHSSRSPQSRSRAHPPICQ